MVWKPFLLIKYVYVKACITEDVKIKFVRALTTLL